ncbi:MAG TPA: aspartyl-phosphate phosphatase Spo0E family protein [Virgibacillus sp.]|nr:aspartyl-phosphate phosphatase Spo0E family protein [Virgibacillus sp.]
MEGKLRLSNIEDLKREIECTRSKMYKAYEKNANDPQILSISQSLDKLLNALEREFENEKG